jgi:acyl-CoA dehydrogenase
MSWDFSTEPEFQERPAWMTAFVREEVWPLETIFAELGEDGFRRAIEPLQERVKAPRERFAHLPDTVTADD